MDTNATPDASYAQAFIDTFEDHIEENPELTDSERELILGEIATQDNLEEGLPVLLQKSRDYKEQIEACDRNVKQWQASKQLWKSRSDQFLKLLGDLMERLHIPGKTVKSGKIKLSTSTRSVYVVDEDWLLGQYQALAQALQAQLPDYVKVTLTVDKPRLNAHLNQDKTLCIDHPDKVYSKSSTSTTIK